MASLRSRSAAAASSSSSPRNNNTNGSFDNNDKGHKFHRQYHSSSWFILRAVIIFGFVVVVYYFGFVVQQEPLSTTTPITSSHIHDDSFRRVLFRLQKEKEDYKHMLQPKKSLFKAFDENTMSKQDIIKKDKKGNIVYKPITSVKKEDLKQLGVVDQTDTSNITHEQAILGRERLVNILHEAGVQDIDVPSILSLPMWSSVTKLYGDGPVVLGLERCHEFQNDHVRFPLWDASIGTAGLFNTGTNPFAMYLESNCKLPKNKSDRHGGTRWQVPWGKHTLASRRLTNTAGHDHKVNKTTVMPIVLVRDPYSWMQSMCTHPYEAKWNHKDRCPNLARTGDGKKKDKPNIRSSNETMTLLPESVPVHVRYKPPADYDSLAHFWAGWYKEYLEADYPRLIVRFEDIQFHAKELIDIVCQCAGAVPRNDDAIFRYVVDSAKWGPAHSSQTNMITAMIKYGSDKNRFKGMSNEDLQIASSVLTPELMDLFGYELPHKTI